MTRDEFIAAARGYLGTPFHHQGRIKGVGVDCAGTVYCALADCGYPTEDVQGYARTPSGMLFMATVLKHSDPISRSQVNPGDLMVFAFQAEPQHVAIVTGVSPLTLLHAYMQVGKVVEHGIDETWERRLRGCFRLKGIQ